MNHEPAPLIRRIDHVGIAVPDLDQAVRWYADTLGARLVHDEVNEDQGVREALVELGDPDSPGETQLQLLAPLSEDSPIGRFLAKRGPGVQQVAYTVADVDAAAADFRRRGLEVLYDTARPGTAGTRVNFVHPRDAGGVLIELVEHPVVDAATKAAPETPRGFRA